MGSSNYNHLEDEVTFGATVDTPTKTQNHLAPNVFDTPKSLSPVVTVDAPSDEPLTPFYATPSADISRQTLPADRVSETDLESARKEGYFITSNPVGSDLNLPSEMAPVSAVPTGSRLSFDGRTKECTMWPTKQTLRNQDRAERAKRRAARACGCSSIHAWWVGTDKRQRLWFKFIVAAFIVAIACGLGIGISKAVGAGVFAGKGQTKPIANA
ncbi:hypothetical protein AUEXF2481DRAFT_34087 [Aureobasidium subglaciale EXF-2481]|uniref:Uncharacterized protein n=1 Tax=Aureobasidium subglaciale (strain EXF-2481) TaxID=1043005 RepID=A0A074XXV3_AURSE|nr:uncharacterized protein AUEXF2481DRAFT_34087 [Aureobasidium subglaciale EXF-2481]KAI5195241.1 hypothetical protein E4T38_09188 [Aureobasidium subglaciale]KAI5214332.1 hypothetical protein E4T40_09102 [Aureobasidium subglaciale]KAI5216855.1 hypothetical protein E4T41_09103 [Aureobasidium subglaciale]KAI5254685.1 hypothetical protein E4T46_09095 [Aureobasidium subglaciale]KEQ90305.1 hypothetical protein AUEXF2481DRAFT_34087 [Aureobasidium subglaciale EXF-2481]